MSAPLTPQAPGTERSETSHIYKALSVTYILRHTVPYLSIAERLSLSGTNKRFRALVLGTEGVFRHADFSTVKSLHFNIAPIDHGGEVWRNVQVDENVAEDDFHGGPLRGALAQLRRRDFLKQVHTLVLDHLPVTWEICSDIILHQDYNVSLLSIRAVSNLNTRKLQETLKYACRPNRPKGTPRLKGLYVFGPAPEPRPAMPSTLDDGVREPWYDMRGEMIPPFRDATWANTLVDCQNVIAFDAILCTGPRHRNSPAYDSSSPESPVFPPYEVARFALDGCAQCHSAPEGLTVFGPHVDRTSLPLLWPLPMLSSTLRAATTPTESPSASPQFAGRCWECLSGRYCYMCHRWWCENCCDAERPNVETPFDMAVWVPGTDLDMSAFEPQSMPSQNGSGLNIKHFVSRSCIECGSNCLDCISRTQKRCLACKTQYCVIHNEGSSETLCDWCACRGRLITPPNGKGRPALPRQPGQAKQTWTTWRSRQQPMLKNQHSARPFSQRFAMHDMRYHPGGG